MADPVCGPPSALTALLRGARRRCPRCGVGPLFVAYLTRADFCPDCGARFEGLDAADGPAWLTIGLVTPLVLTLLLILEKYATLSVVSEGSILVAATILAATILLPVAKGVFLAGLWLMRESGR